MDRVDKILLVLPVLPVADLLSTLFSLGFGGEEVGVLARPVLTKYGPTGLVMLATSASIIFLVLMKAVIHIRKLLIKEWKSEWMQYILTIPVFWLFMLEGIYVSTVTVNILAPISPVLIQESVLRVTLVCAYFVCISVLTLPSIRQLTHLQRSGFNSSS